MAAWGFAYKSNFAWIKERIGTGYWARNRHEHLLVGARGSGICPRFRAIAPVDSVIEGQQREHSRKPDRAAEIIETYHPGVSKLELFARTSRPGWDAWGDQVGLLDHARFRHGAGRHMAGRRPNRPSPAAPATGDEPRSTGTVLSRLLDQVAAAIGYATQPLAGRRLMLPRDGEQQPERREHGQGGNHKLGHGRVSSRVSNCTTSAISRSNCSIR
jgi:hypothetical protein